MNYKQKTDKNRRRRSTKAGQLLAMYIISMIGFVFLLCLAAYIAYYICEYRTWYGTETLYPLLSWIHEHLIQVIIVITLAGAVGITYYFIAEPLRYLDAVVAASEQLAHPSEEPIVLPQAMQNVEDELNLVREQALRNAVIAKEAEQRKNDLIVYLAHDLKTPLTSVIGYLTLLHDEPQISPQLQERYTGIALDKAQRLEDLINEFFDITRFNLTALTIEPRRINLSRMLEQIASEFLPVLADKQLYWQTEIAPDIELVCDPDKLQRVFDNLIRNAVNYSYSGTEIALKLEQIEGAAQISIKNHGRTIPPEKLAHIFEQFYRVDSSRASATGGAGLGLAIAKEIVEMHGGNIRVESADESILFVVCLGLS